ncbi:MAG TPA: aldo/keto reductase, partial [Thermoplasmata archaeon]|nr:aldo/keto reductase [Thermoplasmata archaeon]
SLARLGVDRIDLYQAHEDDPATPLDETLAAFRDLRDRGQIGAVGASNYAAPRLVEAMRVAAARDLPPFVSLQPRYNLMDRSEFEADLAGVCREHRLGVLTYSSLASGFLSGKYRAPSDSVKSARGTRAVSRLTERGLRILSALDQLSVETSTPRSTIALSWLMDRPGVTAAIASATSVAQMDELLAATRLSLDPLSVERLDRASA